MRRLVCAFVVCIQRHIFSHPDVYDLVSLYQYAWGSIADFCILGEQCIEEVILRDLSELTTYYKKMMSYDKNTYIFQHSSLFSDLRF